MLLSFSMLGLGVAAGITITPDDCTAEISRSC